MADEKAGMLQGFKNFVMRGNVIDLAVAVVVGAAFTAVIAAFTEYIINPVLAAVGGGDTGGFGFCLRSGEQPCTADSATFVDLGAVFGVLVSFVITMAVVYFVFVVPMNKVRSLSAEEEEPAAEETPAEIALLEEIRDLLAAREAGSTPGPAAPAASTDSHPDA